MQRFAFFRRRPQLGFDLIPVSLFVLPVAVPLLHRLLVWSVGQ